MTVDVFIFLEQYGVLGIWTITLLVERMTSQKKMQEIIENNTEMLGEVRATMLGCRKRN